MIGMARTRLTTTGIKSPSRLILGGTLIGLLTSGLMGCQAVQKLGANVLPSTPAEKPAVKPMAGQSQAAQEMEAKLKPTGKPGAKPGAKPEKPAVKEANSDGEYYRSALDKADSARSISQSAQGPDDWPLVVGRWQQAIDLLKQVPKSDPNHKYVGGKLSEFKQGMAIAQQKAQGRQVQGELEPAVYIDPPNDANKPALKATSDIRTFQARIKYRHSRIPVIDVVFNGKQTFEMMVDTGASGTMITPEMATKLGVKTEDSVGVMTPAGRTSVDIGYVNSITVGSSTVYRVPVTIGPVNLLGHDFFGDCNISIRKNVVEFEKCSG
jgi:predicted aspartyl protease